MSWEFIIFGVVILHFIIGFGWLLYKLEFEKNETYHKKSNKQLNLQ